MELSRDGGSNPPASIILMIGHSEADLCVGRSHDDGGPDLFFWGRPAMSGSSRSDNAATYVQATSAKDDRA